ncbi:TPA: hypothetical protein ACWWET_000367 [Enterococcus faecalis]|uniref:hypothetical protein n=1 Tax=Enterococcus TaxID=1350 RepID=UPI0001B25D98|nr:MULTISPECIES: hypothetical protein [Enterococcus]EEU22664.1 conserved hypothetical protein [Enterococcus faecalis T3]EGO8220351.1 hypothetical protein [Enterococcus faecalis]EHR4852009.1 hypothetical protein [Enterococcus faecalis]EHU9664004.1 hypothetical protein [Enterococcus faecalis]EIA7728452.1 hypothetical protein [Enterococcus faecalis]
MKNKKRIKFGILIATIIAIAIIGTIGVKKMNEPTEKERQIAFLKEHEEEMTEYVKSQNSKIYSVKYDWESVEVGTIGNGTPIGAGNLLTIKGRFNNIKESNFIVSFALDTKKMPKLDTVGLLSSLYIGGEIFE